MVKFAKVGRERLVPSDNPGMSTSQFLSLIQVYGEVYLKEVGRSST